MFSGVVARAGSSGQRLLERPDRACPRRDRFRQSFPVLGVSAAIGRTFTPEDDGAPGAHPVVMLSHDYWVRRFGGEPGVLNLKVAINGHPMMVIGVAPAGFRGVLSGENPEVFVAHRHEARGHAHLGRPHGPPTRAG